MNIVFDNIIYDLQNYGGISRYWIELTKRFNAKDCCQFYNGLSNNNLKGKIKGSIRESNIPIYFLRYLDFQKKPQIDIFHSSYYRIMKGAKNVVTIHDFTYEYYRKGLAKWVNTFQKNRAIRNAELIICISKNTKKDLFKFYPKLNKKVFVIYNGVSEKFKKITDARNFSNRVIYVGDRKNYKNFSQLISALKCINYLELDIVGGGKLTNKEKSELSNLNFKYHDKINDEDLNLLYNNSFALVYPSLYEGFGLPIIEAFKAGCPVICNNGSSTSEISKDCALVGKISPEFILESLIKLKDVDFRERLINKAILEAKNYSWDRCFEQTRKAYESIL